MEIPERGFYIHYKHDPAGPAHNYTYEVVGLARNSEDKSYFVLYRPLYENDWLKPADYQARPLEMFMEDVEKDGVQVKRFTKITDPVVIRELEAVRDRI
jgi:hypothetical protein